LRKIHNWLRPGGELFLVNDAIYRSVFKPLIPLYEQRVEAGDAWPGHFADVRSCIPRELNPEQFPKAMNFLDPTVLQRELSHAGFEVVAAGFYPYTGSFEPGRLDGREIVGAVARKI
jgi:polyketide synthase PksJ